MGRLDNKVAVITGASSGIGEATAKVLASEGAAVVLAARREERLEDLKSEIEKERRQGAHRRNRRYEARGYPKPHPAGQRHLWQRRYFGQQRRRDAAFVYRKA